MKKVTFNELAKQPPSPAVVAAMQSTETVVSQKFLDAVAAPDVPASASVAPAPFSWTNSYKLPADWTTTYSPQLEIYNTFAKSGAPLITCILGLLGNCPDPATIYRNRDAAILCEKINALNHKEVDVNDLFRDISRYKAAQGNASFEQFRQACIYIIIHCQQLIEAAAPQPAAPTLPKVSALAANISESTTLAVPQNKETPAVNVKPPVPFSWNSLNLPDFWWKSYESQVTAYATLITQGNTMTYSILQVLKRCPDATGAPQNAHAINLIKLIEGLRVAKDEKEPHVNDLFRSIAKYNDMNDTGDVNFEASRKAIKYIIIAAEQEKEIKAQGLSVQLNTF